MDWSYRVVRMGVQVADQLDLPMLAPHLSRQVLLGFLPPTW